MDIIKQLLAQNNNNCYKVSYILIKECVDGLITEDQYKELVGILYSMFEELTQ